MSNFYKKFFGYCTFPVWFVETEEGMPGCDRESGFRALGKLLQLFYRSGIK